MKTRKATIAAAVLLAGCAGVSPSPSPVPAATATAIAPSPPASAAATAAATVSGPASVLEGTWLASTTCAQQDAAVTAAGFTADQLDDIGWDSATCMGMAHGTEMQIRFSGERLVVFSDGVISWDGRYRIVEAETFEAGDTAAGFYLTYEYVVDGDQLVIDMVRDDFPTSDPTELVGEAVAQTVIYESAPFERAP